MFVVYSGTDEVIITTLENEKHVIEDYFINGRRDINDFDRSEANDKAVLVRAELTAKF